MLNRAYSLLEIKRVDEDAREITGWATTPEADRLNDVVEPDGAKFTLPLPLLWQHDSGDPIGEVTHARISKAGIEITAKVGKGVTAEIDRAWALIKAGLVKGLSIGFTAIEHEFIKETKGIRFKKWNWLELSAVTIPANQTATITTLRSLDTAQRAAPGHRLGSVSLKPPGASGSTRHRNGEPDVQEDKMKTIAEQITALEAKRAASASRMEDVMQKSLDDDRTTEAAEGEEFDNLATELDAIDKDLTRLRKVEKAQAYTARPIAKADSARGGADLRGSSITVKAQPKLEPGILFTRIAKARMVSQLDHESKFDIAARMYGADSEVVAVMKANEVVAGSNLSGNWATDLTGTQGSAIADFVTYLRKGTIVGKFGTNGIPSLRTVPFRMPLVSQTGGGAAYWTGEGKPKGLTSFTFARTTLEPMKCANIAVLTEENIRSSNPASDAIVRDSLRDAIVAEVDLAFVDPANAGTALIKPASITNGAGTIVSSGDDADAIRLDLRSLFAKFHAANNPPSSGVLIMPTDVAIACAMMTNALGQAEFPSMGMSGVNATGTLVGFPVIISDYLNDVVILVNASDIYEGGDGTVDVSISREASLEMKSTGFSQDATVGTGASLVSLWQNNLVGIRAEIEINWKRRRTSAVAYLTSVDWGGEPHTA